MDLTFRNGTWFSVPFPRTCTSTRFPLSSHLHDSSKNCTYCSRNMLCDMIVTHSNTLGRGATRMSDPVAELEDLSERLLKLRRRHRCSLVRTSLGSHHFPGSVGTSLQPKSSIRNSHIHLYLHFHRHVNLNLLYIFTHINSTWNFHPVCNDDDSWLVGYKNGPLKRATLVSNLLPFNQPVHPALRCHWYVMPGFIVSLRVFLSLYSDNY